MHNEKNEFSYNKNKIINKFKKFNTPVVVKCNESGVLQIPNTTATPEVNSLYVNSINIDIYDNCTSVIIDFSTIIGYLVNIEIPPVPTSSFSFILSRVCEGFSKVPLETYDFRINLIGVDVYLSPSYAFTFCDKDPCKGCCTYIVEIININTNDEVSLNIKGSSLKATLVKSVCSLNDYTNTQCKKDGSSNLPNLLSGELTEPIIVVSIPVDKKAVKKARLIIDFRAIIKLVTDNSTFNGILINFGLSQLCNGSLRKQLESFSYFIRINPSIFTNIFELTSAYNYTFCSEVLCDECCLYLVEIIDINFNQSADSSLIIDRPTIKATVIPIEDISIYSVKEECKSVIGSTMANLIFYNPIISINVDTRKYKCVDIILDFTTNVAFNPGFFAINGFNTMRFRIVKICEDKRRIPIKSFDIDFRFTFQLPFTFTACDKGCTAECCTYVVEVVNTNVFLFAGDILNLIGANLKATIVPCK